MARKAVGFLAWSAAVFAQAFPARADNSSVQIHEVRGTNTVTLQARLTNCTEATITVSAELQNMVSSAPLPLTVDAAGRKEFTVVTFMRAQRGPAGCQWRFDFKAGCLAESKPQPYLYALPYHSGRYRVLQGPYGTYTHFQGSGDEEAIDWAMPEGTELYAARPGTVVAIRQDCDKGGPDALYRNDHNYVMIKHEDGTVAEYAHLKLNGVLVHVGDKVTTKDKIGQSGSTGQSSQPHLHFAVFNNLSGTTRKTIPLEFKGPNGAAFKPR